MTTLEYLVSYGTAGTLGRFLADNGDIFSRGDRVLVQSERGQETGIVVLQGNGSSLSLPFLPVPGRLLRHLTPQDEHRWRQVAMSGQEAFSLARDLAAELGLPVEVVDVETIGEPLTYVLHHLTFGPTDWRPLVSRLSRQLNAYVLLHDLTAPQEKGGCGSCGEGGCGEGGCGEGGCGTGGCGSGCSSGNQAEFTKDWQAYFAERRADMEKRRVSLPV